MFKRINDFCLPSLKSRGHSNPCGLVPFLTIHLSSHALPSPLFILWISDRSSSFLCVWMHPVLPSSAARINRMCLEDIESGSVLQVSFPRDKDMEVAGFFVETYHLWRRALEFCAQTLGIMCFLHAQKNAFMLRKLLCNAKAPYRHAYAIRLLEQSS